MADLSALASQATPAAARGALKDILDRGVLDDRGRQSVALLQAVFVELDGARKGLDKNEADCPCCGAPNLALAYVNEHLATCPRHPAIVRLHALRDALKLAPEVAGELGIPVVAPDGGLKAAEVSFVPAEPGRSGRYVPDARSLRASVDFFVGEGRQQYPRLVPVYARELEGAVELWERLLHRETDPCRFCGATTSLDDVLPHVLACERHPAALAAVSADAALCAQLGKEGAKVLVALLVERDNLLGGLAALVDACEAFNADLGRGDRGYSVRSYVEDALGRASAAASRLVGLGPREYRPNFDPIAEASSGPDFARPAWEALIRVRENGSTPGSHRGTDRDAEALRKAASEAVQLALEFGEHFTCPACKRPGLWVHQIASHIPVCPAHPAILKERETEARLELAVAVLREKIPGKDLPQVRTRQLPPIRSFWPRAWSDRDAGTATRNRIEGELEKVEFLVVPSKRAKYPAIVEGYAENVASLLSSWQRFRCALESACPYCETESRFLALFAHMAECPHHPALARAQSNEAVLAELGADRLDVPARLRREADLVRVAIARLAEFVGSFRGSFGDDERGRGIVYESLIPKWDHEVRQAKDTLKTLRGKTGSQ